MIASFKYRFDVGPANQVGKSRVAFKIDEKEQFVDRIDVAADRDREALIRRIAGKTKLSEAKLVKMLFDSIPPEGPEAEADPALTFPAGRSIVDMLHKPLPQPRPVIHGIVRRREVCQVTAAPKTNKTWTVIAGSLAIATGRPFLGVFDTEAGNILHIDAELFPSTLDFRYKRVADAMGIKPSELVADDGKPRIVTHSIRQTPKTIDGLTRDLPKLYPEKRFSLIIIDALYKFYPPKFSENDNADVAKLFSSLMQLAGEMGAAVVVIHHASKGNQASKAVTDVGSGAGSMSRAADSYMILREHELEGMAVLEGVTRSFKNPAPVSLKWDFPTWEVKENIAPDVKQAKSPGVIKQEKEVEKDIEFLKDWILKQGEFNSVQVKDAIGGGQEKANGRVRKLLESGYIQETEKKKRAKNSPSETQHYKATDKLSGEAVR